jgi:lipopolysaccharide export LptBFGC system permease protein LptF
MWILDRERYWAFLKAYIICFITLVGLYVVIDAFSNFDEFTSRATGWGLCKVMARYYLVHMSQYYDRLCGVIGMMAAIFTVTWMQKNNELLAMMAAGISTHRVIRPVWISSIIVSALAVFNQERIMPVIAEELQRNHADDETHVKRIFSRYDTNLILFQGREANRQSQTILGFNATLPIEIFGALHELSADQATYIPPEDPTVPLKGGWLLRGADLRPAMPQNNSKNSLLISLANDKGFPPPIGEIVHRVSDTFSSYNLRLLDSPADRSEIPNDGKLVIIVADIDHKLHFRVFDDDGTVVVDANEETLTEHARRIEDLKKQLESLWAVHELPRASKTAVIGAVSQIVDTTTFFLRSDLTFDAVARSRQWYQFAPTWELIRCLGDPSSQSEHLDIAVFLHARLLRPALSLTLMFLSLPLVLGGFGRNMFINLGLSLGTSAVFYAVCFMTQFLATSGLISPEMSAWTPLIGFGTLAMARWDKIRT